MKVILHKIFPYAPYLNEYIGFEDEQRDGETNLEAVARLRKDAEQAHRERYPNLYENGNEAPVLSFTPPIQQTTAPKDERIQSLIATINMCTSLKFLKNFAQRVADEDNTQLSQAYLNKEIELREKQINEP